RGCRRRKRLVLVRLAARCWCICWLRRRLSVGPNPNPSRKPWPNRFGSTLHLSPVTGSTTTGVSTTPVKPPPKIEAGRTGTGTPTLSASSERKSYGPSGPPPAPKRRSTATSDAARAVLEVTDDVRDHDPSHRPQNRRPLRTWTTLRPRLGTPRHLAGHTR